MSSVLTKSLYGMNLLLTHKPIYTKKKLTYPLTFYLCRVERSCNEIKIPDVPDMWLISVKLFDIDSTVNSIENLLL